MKTPSLNKPKAGGIREMCAIAMPMVVSHACDTVMTFTDRLFLSRLGPEQMNAAMLGGLSVFVMMSFMLGLTGYTTALVAQYLGAKRKSKCAVVLSQAVILSVAAYPLILMSRPVAHWVFNAMGLPPGQLEPQIVYFDILVGACLISLLRHCLSGFFSGIGRTRIVMVAAATTMLVNVAANYMLIFGKFGMPAMGIRGAAFGTIVGALCGLAILLWAYLRRRNRVEFGIAASFVWDRDSMGRLVRFGYPAGLEWMLNLVAFNGMLMLFHASGEVVATASTIMFNWDMVSFVPLLGVEVAVTSLVGRYMGASRPERAAAAARSGLLLGFAYSAVVFVFFVFCAVPMVEIFRTAGAGQAVFDQAKPTAVFMLRVASLYVLVQAMFVVFIGALRGAGDTQWAMRFSVCVHWAMALISAVLLHVLNLSAEVCWAVLVGAFLSTSIIIYRRFQSGQWKYIRVVDPEAGVAGIHDDFHEPADL